ncbi:hypothetical protein NRB20_11620 [Nocardia sp. RB20]|uniref:Uncharacterized protein n=1 Tax=Nocardia macrotermitis TaxID=2585198 RepID=A0A7K0CXE5_9NOCA|nr:hypothetical protein [Nocardia macrotermitis]
MPRSCYRAATRAPPENIESWISKLAGTVLGETSNAMATATELPGLISARR